MVILYIVLKNVVVVMRRSLFLLLHALNMFEPVLVSLCTRSIS